MNMFGSTAAVAAASVVPAYSAEISIDDRAILARVVEIVDLLRTRYVCEGWKIDEKAAERALAYFRRRADGPSFKDEDDDTREYQHALGFFRSHGQSVDWIHDGNPAGMICGAAKRSERARSLIEANDDPIMQLIDRHKAATDDLDAACSHLSDMEEAIPDQLRQGDACRWEVDVVETDAPRWTAANIRYNDCIIRQDAIAIEMLKVRPTTLTGLRAMLTYAAQHVAEGYIWPNDRDQLKHLDQDEDTMNPGGRDWNFYLIRNLGEAVQGIAA
jgi:hypothetical protein